MSIADGVEYGSSRGLHPIIARDMLAAMRVLMVHNRYQLAGGEDTVCEAETALLRAGGHRVEPLIFDNRAIEGRLRAARAALLTPYNPFSRRRVSEAINRFAPDVVHVHNWFPLASPAIFDACSARGMPVVWTLHNYRLACVNGLFFRDGRVCEDCLGRAPIPGIVHRCYRGSLAGSAVVAATDMLHGLLGTWSRKVDRMIALNAFARAKFVAAGVPADRLVIKPNSLPDPGPPPPPGSDRRGALFVGRLSQEKGAELMVEAWRNVALPLTIAGTGPDEARLRSLAPPHVRFVGPVDATGIAALMRAAAVLVVPSLWHENYPMVIVEAFAHGLPVIVSGSGALASIVDDGCEGWHFATGDAHDLARVARHVTSSPVLLADAGIMARRRYERDLTPATNLRQLEAIYASAIADRRNGSRSIGHGIRVPG